ncbi:MAG: F0F1 ATP synthase subunit delta [Woeseia sp.]
MADNNTIARPYAEAVFELARETNTLDAWSEALCIAAALLEDGQVVSFLGNPALTERKRLEFLTDLLRRAAGDSPVLASANRHGVNFLRLILENGREAVLPEVASHFEARKAEVENTVDVTVTSAVPLDEDQKHTIAEALKKRLGRQVRLETKLDENLIGGAVIRAGDVVIDGSLRARLQGLAHALTA